MPRDYKHVRRGPERRRGAPGWLWAAAGLALGLFVALLVYLDAPRAPVIGVAPSAGPAPRPEGPGRPPEPTQRSAEQGPDPAERKPEGEPARPRFEFYRMLPDMQVPAGTPAKAGPAPGPPAPSRSPGESYMLQVGAFRTYQEADRLKASLLLLGLDASIETVSRDGRGSLHRVRVGPFSNMSEVDAARRRLKQQSLESVLVKAKT